MKNLRTIARKSVLWLAAAALLVAVTVVLWNPAPDAAIPQGGAAGNEGVVSGDGVLVDNAQNDGGQLPEEHPNETVEINQGGNADPENLNALPIKQLLTWDAINAFPVKYGNMPIAERRQLCVDFFNFSKTALWSPKEDLSYTGNTLKKGTVYGGIPYVTVSTGNVYRLMDFIDESTGIVDARKYMTEAPDANGVYSARAMKLFAGQCSYTSFWGWARVMNSASYGTTYSAVPANNFIMLGDYSDCNLDALSAWKTQNSSCNNGVIDNTPEVMATLAKQPLPTSKDENVNLKNATEAERQPVYKNYALLQKGDGLVYITTAGHFMMCTSDAHVVRNADGTINGTESYVLITDQATGWPAGISDQGDWFLYQSSVNSKQTFAYLFEHYYICFTFQEFQEGDILEETEVSFDYTGNTITKSQLFASKVTANYAIADVYVIVTDDAGKEVYRHIVRAEGPNMKTMTIVEKERLQSDKTMLDVVDTVGTLNPGTYHIEIEVQLGTGERPTVYTGTLKV